RWAKTAHGRQHPGRAKDQRCVGRRTRFQLDAVALLLNLDVLKQALAEIEGETHQPFRLRSEFVIRADRLTAHRESLPGLGNEGLQSLFHLIRVRGSRTHSLGREGQTVVQYPAHQDRRRLLPKGTQELDERVSTLLAR